MMTPDEVKEARLKLGLTQWWLGAALGVTEDTVANWERGRSRIPKAAQLIIEMMIKNKEERPGE